MKLRFSIRDMLWLTLVVALSVALWRENARVNEAYLDGVQRGKKAWYWHMMQDIPPEAEAHVAGEDDPEFGVFPPKK